MPSQKSPVAKPTQAVGDRANPTRRSSSPPQNALSSISVLGKAGAPELLLTPANVLDLQRTIGNQAVARMVAGRKGSLQIQRMPKYKQFVKSARKMTGADESIFTAALGEQALIKAKAKAVAGIFRNADILAAYQKYEEDRSMDGLIDLYDTITYWEAVNNINAGEPWYKAAMFYLSLVKDQIQSEVQADTKKEYGGKTDLATLDEETQTRAGQDQRWRALMPEFMKEIGVAPRYFGKFFLRHPERVESLHKMYVTLKSGDADGAVEAYQEIAFVPGIYLIKPLIVAHFAANADVGRLVGTKSQGAGNLTKAEKKAITAYSTGQYKSMNQQLRDTLDEPAVPLSSPRSELTLVAATHAL